MENMNEKQFPVLEQPMPFVHRPKYMMVSLVAAFIAATAALLVMAVLGGLHVQDLKNDNCLNDNTPQYQVQYEDGNREVKHDRHEQTELSTNRDDNGHVTSLVVLHYNRRFTSIYLPSEEKCYLIGGIVEEAGSFDDNVPIYVGTITPEDAAPSAGSYQFLYLLADQNPVYDVSFYVKHLKSQCSNTNTYWLERKDNVTRTSPAKSLIDFSTNLGIHICTSWTLCHAHNWNWHWHLG